MNDYRENKWPAMVFFITSGLFFFGCVWYLWAGALNPEYYWRRSSTLTAEAADQTVERNGRIILEKNHGVQVDGSRIVYRGIQGGIIHIDLFVLQLDPHYGYPHQIDEGQAQRDGFFIGEHHFQVLAASDGKISLKRL